MKHKVLFILVFLLLLLPLVVVTALPFFFADKSVWSPVNISDLNHARSYFTIVGTLSAVITSVVGLLLGYVYYTRRESFDKKAQTHRRRRDYMQTLIDTLDKYDAHLQSILSGHFDGQAHLMKLRTMFDSEWDRVVVLLESQGPDQLFSESESDLLIQLHSFVDKQRLIVTASATVFRESNVGTLQAGYNERLRRVRQLCISKLI